ncbi:hypothetical protein GCM10020216_095140 [Nonomuraea helvata]
MEKILGDTARLIHDVTGDAVVKAPAWAVDMAEMAEMADVTGSAHNGWIEVPNMNLPYCLEISAGTPSRAIYRTGGRGCDLQVTSGGCGGFVGRPRV